MPCHQQRAVREQEICIRSPTAPVQRSINTNDMARGMQAAARWPGLLPARLRANRKEARPIHRGQGHLPSLKLRYRRGYQWVNDQMRAERALTAALRFPELYAKEGLALDSWVEAGKLNVAVVLPTRILEFRSEGGQHLNDIALQAMLRDANGKVVGDRYLFAKSVAMKPTATRAFAERKRGIANVEAPKKGPLSATVVVYSGGAASARRAGSR
jgi:hypothetical protein